MYDGSGTHGTEEFAAALFDDLMVFTATWEEHNKHLREILRWLREACLNAKLRKYHLAMRETTYPGHVVESGEVEPELDKVKVVREFPRPVTKKDVHSFLGLTGYYLKFIPSYASIAAPLPDLTKCNPHVVNWRPECEEAFHRLKEVPSCSSSADKS